MKDTLKELKETAIVYSERAYAPYSGRKKACILLLEDGHWVPGVRVENASYSLTMPALLNAYTSAVAAGRNDIVGAVFSAEPGEDELALWRALTRGNGYVLAEGLLRLPNAALVERSVLQRHPDIRSKPMNAADGIALAREVSASAYVPESGFPVGCAIVTRDGSYVTGCNVENADWTRILCAERNAIGTVQTLGLTDIRHIYVSAPKDTNVSPCGACRQVLVELAPEALITLDRGSLPHESLTAAAMLPGWFSGTRLRKDR